jgi:glycosyltransferase involved in cell wall biosynthesis
VITSADSRINPVPDVLPIIKHWGITGILSILNTIRSAHPVVDFACLQYPTISYRRNPAVNLLPLLLRLRFPRLRIAVILHEYLSYSPIGRLRILLTLLPAHAIIVPEERLQIILRRFFFFKRNSVHLVPISSNIIPVDYKKNYALLEPITVAHFGIIRRGRGIENIIRAVHSLGRRNIRLLLIGGSLSDDDYPQKILDLIGSLNMTASVTITGYLDNDRVSKLLLASDILLLPFPDGVSERRTTFLTGLDHRIPIITTRGLSSPSSLRDNENVKFVRSTSVADIAYALEELLNDDRLREKIGRGGYEWIRRFTWPDIAASMIKIITVKR